MLYTIRTTTGREDIVIDLLSTRIKSQGSDIKAVFHPAEIKGYVFVEGKLGAIQKAMQGMMHARGMIEKPIQLAEIQHFLEYKKARIKLSEEDIVEIVGGPFKGEKGKIKRIDKVKDEVTIELMEASIPIPVTIATEFIKIIKRAKPEAEEPEKAVYAEKAEKPKEMTFEEAMMETVKDEKSVFDVKTDEPEKPVQKTEHAKEAEPAKEAEKGKEPEKEIEEPEEPAGEEQEKIEKEEPETPERPAEEQEKKESKEPEEPEEPKTLAEELEEEMAAKKLKKKKPMDFTPEKYREKEEE